MNREINFRAWDKERKEYLSGGKLLISIEPGKRSERNIVYLDVLRDPDKYRDRFIIEQCTGLHDSKRTEEYPEGQLIYEGDIVHANNNGLYQGYIKIDMKLAVTFNPQTLLDLSRFDFAEVIGNIHDNPELLKEANYEA